MKIKAIILGILFAALIFMPGTALALDSEKEYDLIVVGSDPEGIAAAVSGARNGLKTLLVDTRPEVGGLMTRGWLNTIDMNYAPNPYGPSTDILNKGIFLEFYRQVEGDSFDIGTALKVFNRMISNEENLNLLLGVEDIEPVINKSFSKAEIKGIKVREPDDSTRRYYCKRLVDATQDADIAALSGVPYSTAQEDMGYPGRYMAATLVFRLQGITEKDWYQMRLALNGDEDPHTGANNTSAWGFKEIMDQFEFKNPRLDVRGLNIGRQNDGSVLINALHIYGVNPLDPGERRQARNEALKELPVLVQYIKENVPGFKNAYLAGTAPEFYIRESRHIYGEYRLTIDDVLENRDFYDRVAFGSYPVDVQSSSHEKKGYVVGNPDQYAVPFRCLVPKEVDNMLVVGRSASFDSLAHGSARVIPVGMAAGQAAGAAAALSIKEDINFRKMAYKKYLMSELQDRLNSQGMEIKPFEHSPLISRHWAYEGLKLVRRHGLIWGNYDNNYGLDAVITAGGFAETLNELAEIYDIEVKGKINKYLDSNAALSSDLLEEILAGDEEILNRWLEKQEVRENIEQNGDLVTRGAAFMLIKELIEAKSS